MVKIFEALTGINKKLGKTKFSDVVDSKKIEEAEKVASRLEVFFQQAIADDFSELKRLFEKLRPGRITNKEYNRISDIAFSIKSRAGNAGIELASKVARSLYQFCDIVMESRFPIDGYNVIRVHYNAIEQIFSAQFDTDSQEKSIKLLTGLEALCKKVITDANPDKEEEPAPGKA